MTSLAEARLYLVSPARVRAGHLADFVLGLAEAGVDLIQLREKDMEAADIVRRGQPIVAACKEAGVDFVVNDRPDIALALDASGVHLGQNDVPVWVARRILGTAIVGRSTHRRAEIESAMSTSVPIDYLAVGPVYETPTKAGRPAAGLELVRFAATKVSLPWFAIGGINSSNLTEVMEAGARRIVVVRAITEADDPVVAARELRERLESTPLD